MSEIYEAPHNIPDGFEYFDSEEELRKALDQIAPYVGRVIIELNSLESLIDFATKEITSSSEGQDRFVYTFLSKMEFRDKVDVLTSLYGDAVETLGFTDLRDLLKQLKTRLVTACETRNTYAHTDWSEIGKTNLVATKYSANRKGVFRVYRTFKIDGMEKDIEFIAESSEALEHFDEMLHEKIHSNQP